MVDPVIFFTAIVALATIGLAIITSWYVWETRLIRKAGQSPSFSLEPTLYVLGGQFHFLYLVNTGQSASDIRLTCSWPNGSKNFYVLSLSNQGRAFLNGIPIAEIVDKKLNLSINLECKDARNEPYSTKLDVDFGKVLDDNMVVSYQFNILGKIVDQLDEIKKSLNRVNLTFSRSIESVKPPLSISLKPSNNPVKIGEQQSIEAIVSEANTARRVIGAHLNYTLISPSGSKYTVNELLTDHEGRCPFVFTFDQIHEDGEYQLLVWGYHKDFQADVAITSFKAV